MQYIQYQQDQTVAVLSMARAKANALNAAMTAEMHAALDRGLGDDRVRTLVLASAMPKFFSAGFDVAEVFGYERDAMAAFLLSYGALLYKLHHAPKPVVAAVSGHCFAGGAILALACDFRVAAQGEFGFALNEINVGVVLPVHVFRLLADQVGTRQARRMVLTGDPVPASRWVETGLADEAVAVEDVLARSLALARSLGEKPAPTYAAVKRVVREATLHTVGGPESLAPPVDPWFTPEAIERKKALLASLKK